MSQLVTEFYHWSVNDCIRGHALGVRLDFAVINELKNEEVCNCVPKFGSASYSAIGVCHFCGRKRRIEAYDGTK